MTNLRSRDAYAARAWDWGFLNACFEPTKIRVSDIDGVVERNGRFLFIEAKPENAVIAGGQKFMFDSMVRRQDTVLILYGEPNGPVAYQHWPHERVAGGAAEIQAFVCQWFTWANGLRAA